MGLACAIGSSVSSYRTYDMLYCPSLVQYWALNVDLKFRRNQTFMASRAFALTKDTLYENLLGLNLVVYYI